MSYTLKDVIFTTGNAGVQRDLARRAVFAEIALSKAEEAYKDGKLEDAENFAGRAATIGQEVLDQLALGQDREWIENQMNWSGTSWWSLSDLEATSLL